MSDSLKMRLFDELEAFPLIDPHTHINPHAAASKTLADILGYHYYTELAHSAGLSREVIEEPEISPKEKVSRLVPWLETIQNTAQYAWLLDICRDFFGFQGEHLTTHNWEALYDLAEAKMSAPDWEQQVLRQSRLDQVYLTNDFDDRLEGFDTSFYVPCLRTDDLVFHLAKPEVRQRLQVATNRELGTVEDLRASIRQLFEHFSARGARACAISLPPDFSPAEVPEGDVSAMWLRLVHGAAVSAEETVLLSRYVFWELARNCEEFQLPFDLMIGVNRRVYPAGVFQGQDLYDRRTSLIQYQALFNAFPRVKFPISVLASNSNQELVSYAWIFPNVIANGHWWYSNTPPYIEHDCRSRLTAIPKTKYVGYYSDMYKLEFALPKFRMYRRILSGVLAEEFVLGRKWSETAALELGHLILRGNVETIFGNA
ncbi:MAG: glucuronate isomerase [Planctomycetaceae bacterium]|nr:glucuronate isomerase [Planctomycetaceae bacterium]